MRKNIFLITLLLLALIPCSSCSSDDNDIADVKEVDQKKGELEMIYSMLILFSTGKRQISG